MKFPKIIATKPPKPLSDKAVLLGKIAAAVMAFFAILQIIGIVKTTESLSLQFYNDNCWSLFVAGAALFAEILSIPFLLRFKMSELARLCSGTLAVVAPWIWVMVVVWSLGVSDAPASQFGILANFNISLWIMAFNIIWLGFNFYVIWKLGLEKTWRKIIDHSLELKKTKK